MTIRVKPTLVLIALAVGLVAFAGVWLGAVSLGTVLTLALIAACPLMMLFMHGGHGHGGGPNPPKVG